MLTSHRFTIASPRPYCKPLHFTLPLLHKTILYYTLPVPRRNILHSTLPLLHQNHTLLQQTTLYHYHTSLQFITKHSLASALPHFTSLYHNPTPRHPTLPLLYRNSPDQTATFYAIIIGSRLTGVLGDNERLLYTSLQSVLQ